MSFVPMLCAVIKRRKSLSHYRPGGYALATILILLSVALFGSGVIITISTLESKISRSQKEGLSAYYVAEAGVRDILWRLNNDSTYAQELMNGNLNRSYSVNLTDNVDSSTTCSSLLIPDYKQLFSVHVYTAPQGARYAIADVTGCSNNGTFTAKRRIQTVLFQNISEPPTGGSVVFSGGDIQIKTGGTRVLVVGGSMYAGSNSNPSISITSQAEVNLCYNTNPCTNFFETPGVFNGSSSNIIGSFMDSTNTLPPPPDIDVPGFDFAHWGQPGNYATRFTNTQFTNYISSISTNGSKTLNGVIYVDGNVNLANVARRKTLNVNGLLVINGSFTVASSATSFHLNITEPGGNAPSGLAATSILANEGFFDIHGVVYSAGDMIFKNTDYVAVDGALISATSVQLNTSTEVRLSVNAASVSRVFGSTQPGSVDVKHWEEEY